MHEFKTLILGEGTTAQICAAYTLAIMGAFLSLLLQTTTRRVTSPESPLNFSWSYLWCDNTRRVLATIILIFVGIRFCPEIIGMKVTMWAAFGIGYANDKIAQILKKKGVLSTDEAPVIKMNDSKVQ